MPRAVAGARPATAATCGSSSTASASRPSARAHRAALIAHFEQHADLLDEDARRRLHSNPLRILDSKNPAMQAMIEAAPQADRLPRRRVARALRRRARRRSTPPASSTASIRAWCAAWTTTTSRVFEWVTDRLGAQGTVCGGGRYDGLFEQLGGKPAPAVGWAHGHRAHAAAAEGAAASRCRRRRPTPTRSCPSRPRCRVALRTLRGAARRRRARCRCMPPAPRPGQHEVAVQEGRRQRRALRADLRRRRAGARRGRGQAAARRRRRAALARRWPMLPPGPPNCSPHNPPACHDRLSHAHGHPSRPRRTGTARRAEGVLEAVRQPDHLGAAASCSAPSRPGTAGTSTSATRPPRPARCSTSSSVARRPATPTRSSARLRRHEGALPAHRLRAAGRPAGGQGCSSRRARPTPRAQRSPGWPSNAVETEYQAVARLRLAGLLLDAKTVRRGAQAARRRNGPGVRRARRRPARRRPAGAGQDGRGEGRVPEGLDGDGAQSSTTAAWSRPSSTRSARPQSLHRAAAGAAAAETDTMNLAASR